MVPATRTDENPVTVDSRNEPTALTHGRTYRRGVSAPESSSLPFFVLIGLAVGLFAFGLMTFCLPDPLEKIAARETMSAPAPPPPPPVFKPLDAAPPPVAEVAPPRAQVTVTTITPAAKQARVVRRHPAKKATPALGAKLPSNPYAN